MFVLMIATFTSCSLDNDQNTQILTEVMPIESVDMPDQFIRGQDHEISITYTKPNSCYQFYDVTYIVSGSDRIVTVLNSVYSYDEANCTGEPEQVTASLIFTPTSSETHIFKFYQGENDQGIDQYHLVEVPVLEGRLNTINN